jgi:hypothetical protein
MKTWQKIGVVFVGGGIVWTLSYLTGLKPELAMIFSSANAAVVGIVAFLTGFTKKE